MTFNDSMDGLPGNLTDKHGFVQLKDSKKGYFQVEFPLFSSFCPGPSPMPQDLGIARATFLPLTLHEAQ